MKCIELLQYSLVLYPFGAFFMEEITRIFFVKRLRTFAYVLGWAAWTVIFLTIMIISAPRL